MSESRFVSPRRRLVLQAGLGAWAGRPLAASSLQLLAGELPPYSQPGEGWLDTRVMALARQARFAGSVKHLPWPRALQQARQRGQSLIYPLARVRERELAWRWLAPLVLDELLLIVRRDALSEAQLRDGAALRQLRVGTLRDSIHAMRLKQEGYARFEFAPHEPSNARKLGLGRIQAWAVTRAVSEYLLVRERIDRSLLHAPQHFGVVALYLAATPDVKDEQLRPWRRALLDLAPP